MPDPAVRPRWERRKDARPAELLAAALDVFVARGYAGTRLDDVAQRAGVSKGTLYLYFENKQELFKAVVRENLVRNIDDGLAEVRDWTGATDALLRYLLHEWWRRIGQTPAAGLTKLMMSESGNFPDIARFYVEEVITPTHAMLAGVIARGVARAEFRPVDIPLAVQVMVAPVIMLTLWSHSFGPCSTVPTDAARFLDLHIDHTIAGLRAGPAVRPDAENE
jgi:AcrR family transcriptional regulator